MRTFRGVAGWVASDGANGKGAVFEEEPGYAAPLEACSSSHDDGLQNLRGHVESRGQVTKCLHSRAGQEVVILTARPSSDVSAVKQVWYYIASLAPE